MGRGNLSIGAAPGFRGAFGSVFAGVGFLLRTPAALPYAAVPPAVLFVLATLAAATALWVVQPWVLEQLAPADPTWLSRVGATAASWAAAAATVALGFVLSLALTPPLSGPALERIVTLVEEELGVPARPPTSFLQEMWCGVRAQAFAAMFVVPTVATLWLVELVFPPSAVVVVPAKIGVASLGLAWNLLDYPLTLRGVRMRERFRFLVAHRREALGFGLAFAALFWVPCFNVLMLPVGVVAATRVLWRTLAADPSALPRLPRPPGSTGTTVEPAAVTDAALAGPVAPGDGRPASPTAPDSETSSDGNTDLLA